MPEDVVTSNCTLSLVEKCDMLGMGVGCGTGEGMGRLQGEVTIHVIM